MYVKCCLLLLIFYVNTFLILGDIGQWGIKHLSPTLVMRYFAYPMRGVKTQNVKKMVIWRRSHTERSGHPLIPVGRVKKARVSPRGKSENANSPRLHRHQVRVTEFGHH